MPYFHHTHGKIYYEYEPDSQAQGPALLCLHGWGTNSQLWQGAGETLKNISLLKVDLPGMGESHYPNPLGQAYLSETAQIILDLLTELKIKRFALLGHSIGGIIACLIASRRVPEVLILDSTPLLGPEGVTVKVKLFGLPKPIRSALMALLRSKRATKRLLTNTIEDIASLPDSSLEDLIQGFRQAHPQALYDSLKDSFSFSVLHQLKPHSFPIFYVIGLNNQTLDVKRMQGIVQSSWPQVEFIAFAQTRHYPPLEQSTQYYKKLNQFLKEKFSEAGKTNPFSKGPKRVSRGLLRQT